MILYEYPFNERIRTYLRLEDLFRRLGELVPRTHALDHHFAIQTIFEVMDVAARADMKTDVLKDLEKHKQQLNSYRGNPAISEAALDQFIARLDEHGGVSVSDLARPFPVSLPAIMKHLDVLSDAGLIARKKVGRTVTCQLKAEPMEQAMNWLAKYERYWTEQLDRLAAFVEDDSSWQASPASPSSAACCCACSTVWNANACAWTACNGVCATPASACANTPSAWMIWICA